MATCFVVMGFKTKTDLATGRKLNLDATYHGMIKPAVEDDCGLECIRADEIPHSGVIDVPMYEWLFSADLVIADISTANPNALYELGVRHALKPRATIIIAEDGLTYPFDFNHIVIRSYRHLGEDIGLSEAKRFRGVLTDAIKAWQTQSANPAQALAPDSPVYTFLNNLNPPCRELRVAAAAAATIALNAPFIAPIGDESEAADETLSMIIEEGERAIGGSRFLDAKRLFGQALKRSRPASSDGKEGTIAPIGDPYLIHRLAFATYKSKQPDEITSLREALTMLVPLNLSETNDPETLGIAGAIEKRLFEKNHETEDLKSAIRYYERGYILKDDYYNGINLAFLLDVRAGSDASPNPADKIADHVAAGRVRRNVLEICSKALVSLRAKQELAANLPDADRNELKNQLYWVLATQAEAAFGLGELAQFESSKAAAVEWTERYAAAMKEALALNCPDWMLESTAEQLKKLDGLLKAHEDLFRKLA